MLTAFYFVNQLVVLCKTNFAHHQHREIINKINQLLKEAEEINEYFNSRQLATTLYCLCVLQTRKRLKFNISSSFFRIWEENTLYMFDQFNSQDLSNTIYSLAKLDISPSEAFINKFMQVCFDNLNEFNSQDLSNTIYSLAKLEISPSKAFINKFMQVCLDTLNQFNSQGLSNTIYSLAKLDISPSEAFINKFMQVCFDNLNEFNSQDLSNTIYSLALLKIPPSEDFIQRFIQICATKIKHFSSQDLSNIIYSLALLSILTTKSLNKLSESIINFITYIHSFHDLTFIAQHQIYLAIQLIQKTDSNCILNYVPTLDVFKSQHPTISNTETRIGDVLQSLLPKENVLNSVWCDVTASYLDFAIVDKNIVFQVDGPTHFNKSFENGNLETDGPTHFQTKLLELFGWTVVRIPHYCSLSKDNISCILNEHCFGKLEL